MTTIEHTDLRARLRSDTRTSHEILDKAVSQFDLATETGLACFLMMQSAALRLIRPHSHGAASCDVLHDLLKRIDADLRRFEILGRPDVRFDLVGTEPLHSCAIDYVIAGSRLGSQVLKKRWQASGDPRVRQANAYFSAPDYIDIWKSFCASTGKMSPVGRVADKVVHDAKRIFELYLECASADIPRNVAIHV